MNAAGGFGTGMLSGLSNVLLMKRQESREEARRKEEQARTFADILMKSGQVKDVRDLKPLLGVYMPEFFGEEAEKAKGKKGAKDGQQHPGDIISRVLQSAINGPGPLLPGPAAQTEASSTAATMPFGQTEPAPSVPGTPQPLQSSPFSMPSQPMAAPQEMSFGGINLMTPEQAMTRKTQMDLDQKMQQIEMIRSRILPALRAADPTTTLDDALAMFGIKTSRSEYAPSFQQVKGKMPDGSDAFGVFDARGGRYIHPITREPLVGFTPDTSGATYHYGVDREALAQKLFDKDYGQLDSAQQEVVMREETKLLGSESQSRAQGTGLGRFNTPVDIPTAQSTGVAVGTKASDVAGQNVPTNQQRDRRNSIVTLKASLEDIRDRLLEPLPTKGSLGDYLPGPVMVARRRMPMYRDPIAKLESAINNTVNVVARSVGEQRGTQTENDALRAEAAIASLRDSLTRGDTRESAEARINETITILDRILGSLPETPVAPEKPAEKPTEKPTEKPAAAAGPSASAPADGLGIINRDGKLFYPDGRPFP